MRTKHELFTLREECTQTHSPLLQAQGVLKDISVELLRHLNQGTAFIQVSTKMNPQGEIRGQVREETLQPYSQQCTLIIVFQIFVHHKRWKEIRFYKP